MPTSKLRIGVIAAVSLVVAITCATVLDSPQIDPDDYRYLELVQRARHGLASWYDVAVVENRWDHLWFVEDRPAVRFFRPLVTASFWLDWRPGNDPRWQLLFTNLLLHGACCCLVGLLFVRLFSPLAAVSASLLFAAFAAHAENIWYVSGRTGTLAALGFLCALWLHLGPPTRFRRSLAVVCYGLGLLAKETVLLFPLLLPLADSLVADDDPSTSGPRTPLALYAAYAAVASLYLILRVAMVGRPELSAPYFVAPWSAEFPSHVALQMRSYSGNLFAGEITEPFATAADVAANALVPGFIPVLCALVLLFLVRTSPRQAIFFAALATLTWLPALSTYLSERYLYLPSVGVAGLVGVAVGARRDDWFRMLVVALVLVWAGHQGWRLYRKNAYMSHVPRDATFVNRLLGRLGPVVSQEQPVLFLNFPSGVIPAQFLEQQLRVLYQAPKLQVRVLSLLSFDDPQVPDVDSPQPKTLRLQLGAVPTDPLFGRIDLGSGDRVERDGLGFEVSIAPPRASGFHRVDFVLERPLTDYTVLRYRPPALAPDPSLPVGVWVEEGQVDLLRFDPH